MRIGGRSFKPSWGMTALMIALCAAFLSLGRWQWERGEMRQMQWQQFARGADRVQPLGTLALAQLSRFQRLSVVGRFDGTRQFMLDNRTHNEHAGYEVLTPFTLVDGRTMLVDRGWVPSSGYRDKLPDVTVQSAALREIVGRVDELPTAGLMLGRAAPAADAVWPKVTSYPTIAELSAALGRKIEPRILLLDPHSTDGYVRDWQPPGLSPLRHWSYAIQWWAFAALTVVLWCVLGLQKRHGVA